MSPEKNKPPSISKKLEIRKKWVEFQEAELVFYFFPIPIPLILSQPLRFILHHPGWELLIYTLILWKKRLLTGAKDEYLVTHYFMCT